MSFPLSFVFIEQPRRRPKAMIIEEILKDSLKVDHDLQDMQVLVQQIKTAKSQDDVMKYVMDVEKDAQDVYINFQQIYTDLKELFKYY